MTRQWEATSFWLTESELVTHACWFSAVDPGVQPGNAGALILSGIAHEEQTVIAGATEIAGALAARGYQALLVEFAGSGQSRDGMGRRDIVGAWLQQIQSGIDYLRRHGAEQIVVVAPRISAALALTATALTHVDALVLWSPVLSGRRYIRELRMLQHSAPSGAEITNGELAVGGYILPACAIDSIASIQVAEVANRPARSVLYMESPGRAVDERTVSLCRDTGASVDVWSTPDTDAWLYVPSDGNNVPFSSIGRMVSWLDGVLPQAKRPGEVGHEAPQASISYEHSGQQVTETHVKFGDLQLSGVVTEPTVPNPSRAAVLYLSTTGPGRAFVASARQDAADGRLTLRFDFAGFGTSPLRSMQREPELYGAHGGEDIRLGVEHLLARGASSVVIVGFCAGAWSSFECDPIPGVVGIAALNVHLWVRRREFAERSKNNDAWQPELSRGGKNTLLERASGRLAYLTASSRRPVRWLSALMDAGVRVGLFFDEHDDSGKFWKTRLAKPMRRHVDHGRIEVRNYEGLGHLIEGNAARTRVFQDVRRFIERCDRPAEHRFQTESSGGEPLASTRSVTV